MILKKWMQALLMAVVFILILGLCSIIETTYTQKATVIEVENNIILMEDKSGHVWEFEASEFSVGDEVELVMNNNHTDLILEDDKIKKIKKIK